MTSTPVPEGRSSYDEVPYPKSAFPQTHPDRLATLARLFGLSPPDLETCRVSSLPLRRDTLLRECASLRRRDVRRMNEASRVEDQRLAIHLLLLAHLHQGQKERGRRDRRECDRDAAAYQRIAEVRMDHG